jgi:hypothetical protein
MLLHAAAAQRQAQLDSAHAAAASQQQAQFNSASAFHQANAQALAAADTAKMFCAMHAIVKQQEAAKLQEAVQQQMQNVVAAQMQQTAMASAISRSSAMPSDADVAYARAVAAASSTAAMGGAAPMFATQSPAAAAVSAAAMGGATPMFAPPSPTSSSHAHTHITAVPKPKKLIKPRELNNWMCNPEKPKSGRCTSQNRKHSCTNEGCLRRCCLIAKRITPVEESSASASAGSVDLYDGTWFQCQHPECLSKGIIVGNLPSRSKKSGPGANVGNTTCFQTVKTFQTHIKKRHQDVVAGSKCAICTKAAVVSLQFCKPCSENALAKPDTTMADAMRVMQQQLQFQQSVALHSLAAHAQDQGERGTLGQPETSNC